MPENNNPDKSNDALRAVQKEVQDQMKKEKEEGTFNPTGLGRRRTDGIVGGLPNKGNKEGEVSEEQVEETPTERRIREEREKFAKKYRERRG